MSKRFSTVLMDEAFDFVEEQDIKVRKKIFQNIRRAEQSIDPKFFKKLTKDIWEFRTLYTKNQYRLLAFWDKEDKEDTLVLATHGFVKKTSQVDKKQIEKAESIRKLYFEHKK